MSLDTATLQTLVLTPGIHSRGLRPLLWGAPGTGKTASFESLCRSMGAECFTLVASQNEPSDVGGLPMFDGDGGMRYALPDWLMKADEVARGGKIAVVFLDELTTCPPSVQAAMLRLVNEHEVRGYKLHKDVVFVAAANPTECAAGGYDLAPPAANRWMHLDWGTPSVDEWCQGMIAGWASETEARPASEIVSLMDKNFPKEIAKAVGAVTGFTRSRRDLLMAMPKKGDPEAHKAWASPRTWDLVTKTIAGCSVMGVNEAVVDDLVAGCVGQGPASEFLAYRLAADLPDPEVLLDASNYKDVFELDTKRPDRTLAVLNSVAALVCPKDAAKRKPRVKAAWEIIGDVSEGAADVAMIAARSLLVAKAVDPKTTRKHLLKLGPVMAAAGEIAGVR